MLAKDRAPNTVTVGPRADARDHRGAPCATRCCTARPTEVDRVKLRYRTQPLACRVRAGGGGRLALELGEPVDGAAPGQVACLMRGDVVVGHGVIA